MLTDTHCHLDSEVFDADRPAVIGRALEAGVTRILLPGINLGSSRRCVELAAENSPLYAAVGLHPTEAESLPADALNQLRDLARRPKVVAVGEIGLDYYWVHDAEQQSRQRELLRRQLLVAAEFNQPVVIHAREKDDAEGGPCAEDLLSMLESWIADRGHAVQQAKPPGVLHSFSSSLEAARRAIGMGFYIGVTGPITYKNASGRRDVIAALPLECLLIETDSPYLAPHPHRGRRNEPAYVAHIADKIATIQDRSLEEVVAVTGANADQLFFWGDAA